MKKQLMIIGIITILVCVGLSGCNQQSGNSGYQNNLQNKLVIDYFNVMVLTYKDSLTIQVDALAYNPITKNITYEISLGENVLYNGKVTPVMAYGSSCTHTYYKWDTNCTIGLIVRDDKGNVNSSARTIHIGIPSVEPEYIEHNTNLPEMNGITHDEVSSLYGITSIS